MDQETATFVSVLLAIQKCKIEKDIEFWQKYMVGTIHYEKLLQSFRKNLEMTKKAIEEISKL